MSSINPNDAVYNQIGETACETKVKYKEVFHFKNLYRYMREWLLNDGWGDHGSGAKTSAKFPEKFYLSNQRADGEETIIWWRMQKPGEMGYYKKVMDIDMHLLYMHNVETVINGQKVKANRGEVEITLRGRLVLDPDHEWRKHWFLKHINKFYWQVLNRGLVEQQKAELYQRVYRFQSALKGFFGLYRVEPEKRGFRATSGLETR